MMKTLFLGLLLVSLAVLLGLLFFALWRLIADDLMPAPTDKTPTPWKVEFNATNGNFYITRKIGKKHYYVSNRLGLKKRYKEQLEAELVVDLLNK